MRCRSEIMQCMYKLKCALKGLMIALYNSQIWCSWPPYFKNSTLGYVEIQHV